MQARSDETRRRILHAALVQFTEQGYFNTSVHDIRRAADVSIGALYHHFGTKEGVAQALYNEILERLDQVVADCIRAPYSVTERSRRLIDTLFELAEEEPRLLGFALQARHQEFMPDSPPVCSSSPFNRMRELLVEGMASGEVRRMSPMVAAAALFGGPLRLVQLRLDGVLDEPLPRLAEECWQAAWRAIAP